LICKQFYLLLNACLIVNVNKVVLTLSWLRKPNFQVLVLKKRLIQLGNAVLFEVSALNWQCWEVIIQKRENSNQFIVLA
jgi:hypothetical protein